MRPAVFRFWCGCFFELMDDTSMSSCSNFCRPAGPGKVHPVPHFLYLWHQNSHNQLLDLKGEGIFT